MSKKLTFLIFVVLVGLGLGLSSFDVQAEGDGFSDPGAAIADALASFTTVTDQPPGWTAGDIVRDGDFAYSIAKSADAAVNEQGHLVLLARKGTDGLWRAIAPRTGQDDAYNQLLSAFPNALIDSSSKDFFYQYTAVEIADLELRAASSHSLPWPIREWAKLTQKNGSYHTNQLDFVIGGTDDIYAAKPGTVVFVKDISTTGGCNFDLWSYANMIVVQHGPAEFSWYVHLKAFSATVEVGDVIGYGTKIGEQGNTGFSCGTTGIHLHYMVSTAIPAGWPNPTVDEYAPWPPSGTIVPVDFREISWAGLSEGEYYESENAPSPGVCNDTPTSVNFYDGTYCSGSLGTAGAAGLVNLVSMGLADRVESIEVPAGWSAALYQDENEMGAAVCLNGSDPMLWDDVFSDAGVVANRAAWMRVYQQSDCPYPQNSGMLFYPETGFSGDPIWGMVGARMTNGPEHLASSIYIPNGYSAQIYDQDGYSGNALCFSTSVPDLSALGWGGVKVESVNLVWGDICGAPSGDVPIPVLVKPVNNGVTYIEGPTMCWQVAGDESDYSYQVQIEGDGFSDTSDWLNEACWNPTTLGADPAAFTWKAKARNAVGVMSNWSAEFSFTTTADLLEPVVSVSNFFEWGEVIRPRTVIHAEAVDNETWVKLVHFFAWYDDGGGAGYDWHYLGEDNNPADGWTGVWGLTDIVSADAAIWVYAEDMAGNSNDVIVSNLQLVDAPSSSGGSELRDGGGRDNTGGGPPVTGVEPSQPPEIPSELPIPAGEPVNNGGAAAEEPSIVTEDEPEAASESEQSLPSGKILSPLEGSIQRDQIRISTEISEGEIGVREITFLAWYDDGNGPAWHQLGAVDSVVEAREGFLWDVTGIAPQEVQIWVYILDDQGNFSNVSVKAIEIRDDQPRGMADTIGRGGGD